MSDFSIIQLLKQLAYFAHVTDSSLEPLVQQATKRQFRPNEMIFLEGDPSAGLWILESGRVKAFKLSPDGHEYVMSFFGPGTTFNDLAALDGAQNAVNTMAVTDVVAWVIPSAVFVDAMQTDIEMCHAVIEGLIGRVRHLVSRVEDLALRPVTARLARFLMTQVEDETLDHPAITRQLIANHLATTPESISRSLRLLEELGAIEVDRHQITIANLEKLQQQAML